MASGQGHELWMATKRELVESWKGPDSTRAEVEHLLADADNLLEQGPVGQRQAMTLIGEARHLMRRMQVAR